MYKIQENNEQEIDLNDIITKRKVGAICLTAIVIVMLMRGYPYSRVIAIVTMILQILGLNEDLIRYALFD